MVNRLHPHELESGLAGSFSGSRDSLPMRSNDITRSHHLQSSSTTIISPSQPEGIVETRRALISRALAGIQRFKQSWVSVMVLKATIGLGQVSEVDASLSTSQIQREVLWRSPEAEWRTAGHSSPHLSYSSLWALFSPSPRSKPSEIIWRMSPYKSVSSIHWDPDLSTDFMLGYKLLDIYKEWKQED